MDRKEDTDMHSDANDSKERAALLRAMQAEQERQRVREQILQDRIAMNQALTAAEQANEATRATFAQSFQDPFSPFFIQR